MLYNKYYKYCLLPLEIIKQEDLNSLNARRIAQKLKCSVQPIFYHLSTMDNLKKAIFDRVYALYREYMADGAKEEKPYKGMGLSYIRSAKDYPNDFKLIFMNQTDMTPDHFITKDTMENHVIEEGMKLTGLDYEK